MQNVTNVCPPEQGDMEQPLPDGGVPPLPSEAPAAEQDTKPGIPSAFAMSLKLRFSPFLVFVNPTRGTMLWNLILLLYLFPSFVVGWGPESKGQPGSHHAGPTFEPPSDHGNQRWEKAAEEHKRRKSKGKKAEETELVILDPEHVRSVQILLFLQSWCLYFSETCEVLAVSLSPEPRAAGPAVNSAVGKSDPFSGPGREVLAARVTGWVLTCSFSGMVLIFRVSLFGISKYPLCNISHLLR